jgi:Zn-finger nucleic acid-binding protein
MPRCPLCRSALVTITFGLYPIAICTSCSARWIQDGRQQRAINQVQEPTLMAGGRPSPASPNHRPHAGRAYRAHRQLRPWRTPMVIHYPPARLRYNSDQPTAITNVLVATSGSSSRTGDIPLGTPTCSARTRRGRWALYPSGEEVVVVWPGGALTGSSGEIASELDRLGGDGHDDLDRGALWVIRQFLTDPAADDAARWSSARARSWSSPAVGYWLNGPRNQSQSGDPTPAGWSGAPAPASPIPLPDPSPEPAPARAA